MTETVRAGDAYVIGESLFSTAARPKRKMLWNPDDLNNGHVLIWGGSGSGKSVFLRDVIGYLRDRKKHIHVLDLHGDLHVEGENSMQFGTWDAQYGVNPFEFLREYNAGPEQQTHEIVEMFRKTYMRNMGPLQEAVLRRLILDTYKLKGIMPRDMSTWGDKSGENLPVMEDMLYLIQNILEHGEGVDEEVEVGKQVMKLGEKLGKLSKEYQVMQAEQDRMVDNSANEEALQSKAAQLDKHKRKIDKARLDLQRRIEQYIEERFILAVPPEPKNELAVDYKFYLERKAKGVVENLRTYVDALVSQGVFSATPPPVRAGLNRYDLSKMLPKAQIFFCDVLIGKVFRALQMRGEYMKLNDTGRGKRLDTYIVIDEAQKILPDKQADRDRPNLLINRIMSEARKYGLGLIVVTQSPSNFSHIMLANASQKIGFNTNANDIPAAKRLLGIQQDHLFEHAKRKGVAIVSDKQGYLSALTRVPELIGIKADDDDGPAIGAAMQEEDVIPPPMPDDHAFGGPPELTVIEGQNQSRPAPQPAVAPRF